MKGVIELLDMQMGMVETMMHGRVVTVWKDSEDVTWYIELSW